MKREGFSVKFVKKHGGRNVFAKARSVNVKISAFQESRTMVNQMIIGIMCG